MEEDHDAKKEKKYQRKPKEVDAVKLEERKRGKQDVKPVDVIQFTKGPFYIQF